MATPTLTGVAMEFSPLQLSIVDAELFDGSLVAFTEVRGEMTDQPNIAVFAFDVLAILERKLGLPSEPTPGVISSFHGDHVRPAAAGKLDHRLVGAPYRKPSVNNPFELQRAARFTLQKVGTARAASPIGAIGTNALEEFGSVVGSELVCAARVRNGRATRRNYGN